MRATLFAYEPALRLTAFGAVFVVMTAWEFIAPRRKQEIGGPTISASSWWTRFWSASSFPSPRSVLRSSPLTIASACST